MDEKLYEKLTEAFRRISRQEIRAEIADDEPVGISRIGGKPLLPENFRWPYYEGECYDGERENRPLAFLAQIDLSEIADLDAEGLLPATGVLSFFMSCSRSAGALMRGTAAARRSSGSRRDRRCTKRTSRRTLRRSAVSRRWRWRLPDMRVFRIMRTSLSRNLRATGMNTTRCARNSAAAVTDG